MQQILQPNTEAVFSRFRRTPWQVMTMHRAASNKKTDKRCRFCSVWPFLFGSRICVRRLVGEV